MSTDKMRQKNDIQLVDNRYVFCRLNGERIKSFNSAWRTTRKLAGFDDLHFHDMRHTFCSNLLLSGADLKDANELIGHSDLPMTDRYSHLTNIHEKIIKDRLAEHYANHTSIE